MSEIKLPGGGSVFHMGTPEAAAHMEKILHARYAFALAYCKAKGWGEEPEKLSIPQIMEIRAQEGWKNPLAGGSA